MNNNSHSLKTVENTQSDKAEECLAHSAWHSERTNYCSLLLLLYDQIKHILPGGRLPKYVGWTGDVLSKYVLEFKKWIYTNIKWIKHVKQVVPNDPHKGRPDRFLLP